MKRRRPPRRHRTSLAPTTEKVGLPPGELRYTGTPRDDDVRAHLVASDGSTVRSRTDLSLADAIAATTAGLEDAAVGAGARWLDVVGVHDVDALREAGRALNLHPLTLEDLAHVGQRPKVEPYEGYLLLIARSWTVGPAIAGTAPALRDEQVAIVLRGELVVTFRERAHEGIDALRARWGRGRGRVREGGAAYLTYALLDLLVDQGFVATEALSEALSALEERVLEAPEPVVLTQLTELQRELAHLRRVAAATRQLTATLRREPPVELGSWLEELRDVDDHALQVLEAVDTLREVSATLHQTYASAVAERTNEVVRVLTLFTAVFMPITFVAGVYGMNFVHMPELAWRWGYLAAWGLMAGLFVATVAWFRRRHWL
ncbi:MAG: magnesium/cobalt transporter CorA [Trueperaceae bacterium]